MASRSLSPQDRSSSKSTRPWLRAAIALVLFGALLYFFWPLIGEFREAVDLFRVADWKWLVIAIILQVISYTFLTWLNALALKPFSGKIGFGRLAEVLTSMAFISVAIPSAGLSGVALRVHLLRKFGYYTEESLFSLAVETSLEVFALATVAVLGIGYLLPQGGLSEMDFVWLSLMCIALAVIVLITWRIVRDSERSRRMLIQGVKAWNKWLGRFRRLNEEKLNERLDLFQANMARYSRGDVLKLFLAAYGKVILDVFTLGACFYLFLYAISPATLFVGYGLVLSLSGLTALPGGLIMTDASVPVIFSWLGVAGAVALAAGLTYRLIAFWLVRFVGFFSWLDLERLP